jgi:general secretion pathway protein G
MSRNRSTKRAAFTLVELLIVIIIIAVLAAIAIPKFANSSTRSKESALRAELSLLRNAVELFKNDCGSYPSALADLAGTSAPANGKDSAGANKAITAGDYKGPYISKLNNDPVSGAAFTYSVTSPTVGKISSSASGNDSDGNAFSGY